MMLVFGRCKRLVVYGLSFDPLDAELGVVVGSAGDRAKEVIVIDPNPEPVVQRIRALMLPHAPKIEGRIISKIEVEGQG